jgi:VanZ family protein
MRVLSVIVILIAYGSLYPGNISEPDAGAVKQFLTNWNLFTSRGDMLGNVALFFPLGMAGILFTRKRFDSRIGVAALLFLALIYSFSLQLAQIWLPSRSAALADVAWNMVGMAAGIATAHLIATRSSARGQSPDVASLVPLVVLVLWLLTELLPLVPSLDMQKFKDALKPLFLVFSFSFPASMMHAAGVAVAGSAFTALGQRAAWWLGASILLVWAGKVVIMNLTLDASLFLGTLAGYGGYLIALRAGAKKPFAVAFWLLLAAWSITALTPFSPASGGTFNGIPFATMLQGSLEVGVRGLVQSLFIYTALIWLAHRTGLSIGKAVLGLAIWSSFIELMQMGLLGRTADITELILLLLVGWVLSAAQARRPAPMRQAATPVAQPQPIAAASAEVSGKRALGLVATGVGIGAATGWLITQSPLTPYNVRELIYEGHPIRSLISLAALLYWAIGFPILIAQWLARGELYLLSFLPLALLHGLIAWLLLWSSVPTESIHDIVGSPVLGWPWEWELLGRFLALFSLWSVAATAGTLIAAWRLLPNAKSALLGWSIGAFLLIPLSYYIVVSEASTDNLVELIANNGSMGAFLLIGLAMAEIAFGGTTAALASSPGLAHRTRAVALVLACGILAYFALYFGTEQVIVKYGQVFSAMQFLLSSDRSNLAAPGELIARYIVLYGLLIAAIMMVQYPLWRWVLSILPPPGRRMSGYMPHPQPKE